MKKITDAVKRFFNKIVSAYKEATPYMNHHQYDSYILPYLS